MSTEVSDYEVSDTFAGHLRGTDTFADDTDLDTSAGSRGSERELDRVAGRAEAPDASRLLP